MGWVSGHDEDGKHEGWIAMTYADGAISSGTSNHIGHWPEGYTYDPEHPGRIMGDPRPWSEVTGWLPRCECGWIGIETPAYPTGHDWSEPNEQQEDLLISQWQLHIRDLFPKAYAR